MRLINTLLVISCSLFLLIGCGGGGGGGTDQTEVELDTSYNLPLTCEDEGIYPEDCVLEDPNNPYLYSYIDENNKWDLHNTAPSAKSRFYLWATALARNPNGENQYYTASALHELFTEGDSPNAQAQAIKAYRSVMDNFYEEVTFFIIGDIQVPFLLRNLSGARLYDPGPDDFIDLFDSPADALDAMDAWGYVYDPDTKQLDQL